jgi:hypothetical protein
MQHVCAVASDAVNVIADHREAATFDATWLGLEEFLETVFEKLFVFHVVGFVFFWKF